MRLLKSKVPTTIERVLLVIGVFSVIASFHLLYVVWLNPSYAYMGFTYPDRLNVSTWVAYALGILPALWMPIGIRRPSQFIHWMIYQIVYLPSLLVPTFLQLRPEGDILWLQFFLFAGFVIIGASYWPPVSRIRKMNISPANFHVLFFVTVGVLIVWVIVLYWGHFQYVSWRNVYEGLRNSGGAIAEGTGVVYAITWLGVIVGPSLMALALFQKRPWLFLLGTCLQIMLYMTMGGKNFLFSPAYVLIMFVLLGKRQNLFGLKITWAIALFFIVFCAYVFFLGNGETETATMLGSNIAMRTFAIPGVLIGQYHAFSMEHPFTYYSHITGISWIIQYPFPDVMGIEVGNYFGNPDVNANACFWATDGLVALGLAGILVISVVMAAAFYFLDCVSSPHKSSFIMLSLSQYVLILCNVSFFTSLLTGGLLLFILFSWLKPAEDLQKVIQPARRRNLRRIGREKSISTVST